jgi:Tol biopolymer transport system component
MRLGFARRTSLVFVCSITILALLGSSAQAAFPGKNGRIAFERWSGRRSYVWTMEADGSSQKRLLPRQGRDPAWSPDGTRVASWADASIITVVDADGSDVRTLTYGQNRDITNPRWSPNGRQLVFNGFAFDVDDGSHDAFRIMIANSDDGRITFVAPVPFPHKRMSSPTWSPRADRIAFVVGEFHDSTEVFTMTPEGEDLRRLTDNGADEVDLDWSPDGSRLVYVRTRRHSYSHNRIESDIAVMGKNGHDVSILTHTKRNEGSAAFSPNGKRIVFDRCCYGESRTSEIFVMRTDGTHVVRLTHNEVYDSAPDWQPNPTHL